MKIEIEVESVISYKCPKCDKKYIEEKDAIECAEQVEETHRFKIGDVIVVSYYPGYYLVNDAMIISKLKYENEIHKTGSYYELKEQNPSYLTVRDISVKKFIMSIEDRIKSLNKVKKLREKLNNDGWDCDEVEWDNTYGRGKIEVMDK